MPPNIYQKPYAGPLARVAHLKNRGLIIPRPKVAAQKIEQIGYERLRIYILSRRDQPGKTFRRGTTYNDILQLYECDAKLRSVCFEAVGRFELLFRNTISETVSAAHGSHPYRDKAMYKNAKNIDQVNRSLLRIYLHSKDRRAKNYETKYDAPALPPIWTLKEFITFGTAAKHLYPYLSDTLRDKISQTFGVPSEPVFASWLKGFVDLRNFCAHHDRLFNRHFPKQPQRYKKANVPSADPRSLKAILECLDHTLQSAGSTGNTTKTVSKIIRQKGHSAVIPAEVGY